LLYSYISSFIERARHDRLGIRHAHLAAASKDLILLVTDLQPDIPPADAGSTTYLNDAFEPLISEDHLAIGLLPVVSRFIGPVYDTGLLPAQTNRPDAPQLTADDHQPFFLIPIGQEEDVKWMLDNLKQIRDATLPDSRSLDYVMFSGRVPELPREPFQLQMTPEDDARPSAMPAVDDTFRSATPVYLSMHRRSAGADTVLQYRPKPVSLATAALPYRIHIDDPPAPAKVWVYLGGPSGARVCRQRWTEVTNAEIFQTARVSAESETSDSAGDTAPSGDTIRVTLSGTEKQRLLSHAVYYFEEVVTVSPMPGAARAPQWVRDWSLEPGITTAQERLSTRDKRPGQVSVGVNSLVRLFNGMRTPRPDHPTSVPLRFAMSVDED
jgi:hypothetical protein